MHNFYINMIYEPTLLLWNNNVEWRNMKVTDFATFLTTRPTDQPTDGHEGSFESYTSNIDYFL